LPLETLKKNKLSSNI